MVWALGRGDQHVFFDDWLMLGVPAFRGINTYIMELS